MKVAVTTEAIVVTRAARPKKENPFDAVIVSFNDGQTRRIDLEEGDVLSTVLGHLRSAAHKIGRGVKVAYDGKQTVKDARTFRFELRDKIARKATPEAATAPVAPDTSPKGTKASKAA